MAAAGLVVHRRLGNMAEPQFEIEMSEEWSITVPSEASENSKVAGDALHRLRSTATSSGCRGAPARTARGASGGGGREARGGRQAPAPAGGRGEKTPRSSAAEIVKRLGAPGARMDPALREGVARAAAAAGASLGASWMLHDDGDDARGGGGGEGAGAGGAPRGPGLPGDLDERLAAVKSAPPGERFAAFSAWSDSMFRVLQAVLSLPASCRMLLPVAATSMAMIMERLVSAHGQAVSSVLELGGEALAADPNASANVALIRMLFNLSCRRRPEGAPPGDWMAELQTVMRDMGGGGGAAGEDGEEEGGGAGGVDRWQGMAAEDLVDDPPTSLVGGPLRMTSPPVALTGERPPPHAARPPSAAAAAAAATRAAGSGAAGERRRRGARRARGGEAAAVSEGAAAAPAAGSGRQTRSSGAAAAPSDSQAEGGSSRPSKRSRTAAPSGGGGPAEAAAPGARAAASGAAGGAGAARRRRILVAATGSVAAVKLPELVAGLAARGADVRVVATESARHFFGPGTKAGPLPESARLHSDDEEWRAWEEVGDEVLHIELRRWADVLVVAPLSANTLAKAAGGLCDNLVTCVLRAWDYAAKPVLLCPAMNTVMWDSPFTARHLTVLEGLGATVVAPVEKKLACGDVGKGAMAAVATIVEAVGSALEA